MAKVPLILLPGTLCDERLWETMNLSDLAEVKVCDVSKADTIEGLAKSVLEDAPERFALAGLSLGGIISLEIMRLAPERVMKLALLDTNPNPPQPEQISGWERFIEMANNGQFLDITRKYLLPVLIHQDRRHDEALVSKIIDMAEKVGKVGYINQLKAVMTRSDQRPILSAIDCPTMILVGKEDMVCPVQMSEFLTENIPGARLEIVNHSGHLSALEQPEKVSALLRDWLMKGEER
ncbi:alpha/beta hydrolase [Peribacillus muralis]|uniref:alpha/beta fold hydrolase n=1 Tax=Peribacillus muralis TaxID=264697 RepID=UPI001F4D777F|nr:alpha/beta hydrolase [Peribacillus muralis]MCK1992254.1 alpha/beta hydrolase [Peribacillus muralis]MCK2012810.1 alpha/beta hydrolase [Peribacillus muralis]